MKKNKKIIFNLIFFILLIVVTFYVLLKDQNIFDIFNMMINSNKAFVLIAIFCMFLYLLLEGVNLLRTIRISGNKDIKLTSAFKYALIGFFFSAITPAASGGQPMQVYYMHKDKISIANSTLSLLINLTSMQVVTICFALISLFFNYQYLNPVLIVCFIIGIALNSSALALLLIGIFSKRLSKGLMNFVLKVLKFFKFKNIEEKRQKFEDELYKYQQSAIYIRNNRKLMLITLLTTLLQFTIYYSITYWVYRALGFNEYNIVQIITMQSVLFATVSGIPSPGAVGVSEGAFIEIFRNVYPKHMISSAVLLNRGINFYLYVFICGIVTIINHFKRGKGSSEDVVEEELI